MQNLITATFLEAVKKGLISLGWRVLMIVVSGFLAILVNSIGLLNLSPAVTAVIGLILGEVTKQWNSWSQTKQVVAGRIGQ